MDRDKIFFTSQEVAEALRISVETLRRNARDHEVFLPCKPGVYHRGQVSALVKVWAGALTPEEGLAEWTLEKDRMRPAPETSAAAKDRAKKPRNQE